MSKNKGILNETYYGKDNILLECENYVLAMKNAMNNGTNPNKIPEKTKFEELMRTKFNCQEFHLSILADESYLNAFTMPYFFDRNNDYDNAFFSLVFTKSGIKFKNSAGKALYLYTNTYTLRNMDVTSVMAIFLHEIGHNFAMMKEQIHNRRNRIFADYVLEVLQYLDSMNYRPFAIKIAIECLVEVNKELKKGLQASTFDSLKKFTTDKAFSRADKEAKSVSIKTIRILSSIISTPIRIVFGLVNNIVLTLLFPLLVNSISYGDLKRNSKKEQGYNAEKFADNFAASYGYGSGIANTFLNSQKFSYQSKVDSKIPILRVNQYYSEVLQYFTMYMSDEHPTSQTRVLFTLEKLKHELKDNKDNLSPKQIAEIEKDIAIIEKLTKKTPYFKKAINSVFKGVDKARDKAGSIGISDTEIYDFDEKLIKDRVVKEQHFILTNEGIDAFNEYIDTPLMEILNEDTDIL